jgi:hypothetical protein
MAVGDIGARLEKIRADHGYKSVGSALEAAINKGWIFSMTSKTNYTNLQRGQWPLKDAQLTALSDFFDLPH